MHTTSATTSCALGLAAALLAVLLALPMLGGCGSAPSDDAATTDSGTAADSTAATSGDTGEASGSSASGSSFDYSAGLDDNGFWQGVTALDLVEPCDYKNIQVPASQVVPTDEQVQAQVDNITAGYATTSQVTDRAVEDGDSVNIDYVGTIDGVAFEGGDTKGNGTTVTIGVTNYIDDFLEQLIGHMPGETFDVEVTFPEDYGKDELNGKDAVFSVTINYISETTRPEVTDEWVAANLQDKYGWTTVAQMRQEIADALQANAVSAYVQSYVVDNSTVTEVPEVIVRYQEDLLVSQYQSYADSFGLELSQMLQMAAGVDSVEALLDANREAIDTAAKSYLVFQAVAEDAGITVDDSDVAAYFTAMGASADLDSLKEHYGAPYLAMCALVEQIEERMVASATIVEDA